MLLGLAFRAQIVFESIKCFARAAVIHFLKTESIHVASGCGGIWGRHCCCLRAIVVQVPKPVHSKFRAEGVAGASTSLFDYAPWPLSPSCRLRVRVAAKTFQFDPRHGVRCKGGCWAAVVVFRWKKHSECAGPRPEGFEDSVAALRLILRAWYATANCIENNKPP